MYVEIITVLTLGYSCFSYASLLTERLDPWMDFIIKCASILLQNIALYADMHRTFPMVVFEDDGYEPRLCDVVIYWVLGILYFVIMGAGVIMTIIFVDNIENEFGALLFHLITLCLTSFTLVAFLREAFSDYSGHAYCDFLDRHNNAKAERATFPSCLCANEMEIYKREFYLVVKRA